MSASLCNRFYIIIAVVVFAHSSDSFEEDCKYSIIGVVNI